MVCFSSIAYLSSPQSCREQRKSGVGAISRILVLDPGEKNRALLGWAWVLMVYIDHVHLSSDPHPWCLEPEDRFPTGIVLTDPAVYQECLLLVYLYTVDRLSALLHGIKLLGAQSNPSFPVFVCLIFIPFLPQSGRTLELCGLRLFPLYSLTIHWPW